MRQSRTQPHADVRPLHPSAGSCYTHSWHHTAGTKSSFLSQHTSYPGTATDTTTNVLLSYGTTLQAKAADRLAHADSTVPGFFLPPRRGARGPLKALQRAPPRAAAVCVARGQELTACALISLTGAQTFQSYYLILEVQRGISELPVIPNICGRVNNISSSVFSCNSFDMESVNLR